MVSTSEATDRERLDDLPTTCGWAVQDSSALALTRRVGIAAIGYFDVYLSIPTAMQGKHTLGFIRQNLAMEHGHGQAVLQQAVSGWNSGPQQLKEP